MKSGHVLVVGSLHYDIVLNAPHLPVRDETVMGENVQFVCGGKGGNQAVAASQHGADVSFVGAVGKDFFADALLRNLEQAGVETSGIIRHKSVASGMSVAIVETSGDYGAVVASGANQMLGSAHIDIPTGTAFVVLQNEVPEAVNIAVAKQAKEAGAQIILNAAPMRDLPEGLMTGVDILIVNRVEAASLFGGAIDSVEGAITALRDHRIRTRSIVITLGADGLVFKEGNEQPSHLSASEVKVISSHGAGDAFVGALSSRLADSTKLESGLIYAAAAAALHVSAPTERRSAIKPADVEELLQGVGASSRSSS